MSGVLAEFDRDWAPEPGDTADLLAIREWLVARTGTESERTCCDGHGSVACDCEYLAPSVPDGAREPAIRAVHALEAREVDPSVEQYVDAVLGPGARETALRERIEALAGQWERLARVKNSYSEIRHSHARDLRAALAAEDES